MVEYDRVDKCSTFAIKKALKKSIQYSRNYWSITVLYLLLKLENPLNILEDFSILICPMKNTNYN